MCVLWWLITYPRRNRLIEKNTASGVEASEDYSKCFFISIQAISNACRSSEQTKENICILFPPTPRGALQLLGEPSGSPRGALGEPLGLMGKRIKSHE